MYTISLQTISYTEVLEYQKGIMRRTLSTLSNLKHGKRPARLSTIRELAESLNIETKEMMKGVEQ